jgi:very-short-patch-repair endonuclease
MDLRTCLVELSAHAQRQDGLVTDHQVLATGLSRKQLRRLQHDGFLERWHPGVLRLSGAGASPRQAVRAAVMASQGAASHLSAAWLHGLVDQPPRQPEISLHVSRRFTGVGVRVHRQKDWTPDHLTTIAGIDVTDLLRTVVDCGLQLPYHRMRRIIEHEITLGHLTIDELVQRRFQLARRGRDGVGPLRLLLAYWAPDLAGIESDLEAQLAEVIFEGGLPRPQRQYEVLIDGETYRLDMAYPEQRIAIEADGFGVHSNRNAFERDRGRQNKLVLAGWLVLRFTWQQIIHHPDVVVATIRRALEARSI